jgi:hypothetical protein
VSAGLALGVNGLKAELGDHICGLYCGDSQRDDVVIPFLEPVWRRGRSASASSTGPLRRDVVPDMHELLMLESDESFAGIVAEAPVPLDPSAVTARVTEDVSRELDMVLNAPGRTSG